MTSGPERQGNKGQVSWPIGVVETPDMLPLARVAIPYKTMDLPGKG